MQFDIHDVGDNALPPCDHAAEVERLRKMLDAAQTALEGSEWALDTMRAIRPYASDAEKTVIWTKDWSALRTALEEEA